MSEIGKAKLSRILAQHALWLSDSSRGTRADFTGANLHCAKLQSADLRWAIFKSANLKGANLTSTNVSDADFTQADLGGALMHQTDFSRANFTGARLRDAIVTGATGVDANFTGAVITQFTCFDNTDLRGAVGLVLPTP